jgi:hypothetical protein
MAEVEQKDNTQQKYTSYSEELKKKWRSLIDGLKKFTISTDLVNKFETEYKHLENAISMAKKSQKKITQDELWLIRKEYSDIVNLYNNNIPKVSKEKGVDSMNQQELLTALAYLNNHYWEYQEANGLDKSRNLFFNHFFKDNLLNISNKYDVNILQERIIKKIILWNGGFWNWYIKWFEKEKWNYVVKISEFEINMRGVKTKNDINRECLYNYIQYLKSRWFFTDEFIKKFNNPLLTIDTLKTFDASKGQKNWWDITKKMVYEEREGAEEEIVSEKKRGTNFLKWVSKNLENIKKQWGVAIKYTLNAIDWNIQEKTTNKRNNSPTQKRTKEDDKNPPKKEVTNNTKKEQINRKNYDWEKIHITLWGRNINVSLEKSEWWYNIMYRWRIILPDLTQDEVEKTNKNPQVWANLIKFHRIFNSQRIGVNLPSIWRYRNEIIKGIDNTKVNQSDDFLNENEVLRFLNIIITFINKSWWKLAPAWNTNQMRESLKSFSWADNFLNKKAKNERGEDKFAKLLRNNWVIREDDSFNIIKFQAILNQEKKS